MRSTWGGRIYLGEATMIKYIYTDEHVDGSTKNEPVKLTAGKVMGLMIAWCDNDGSELRENFIGSESAPGEHKDRGWIDAGLFGKLLLVD